MNEIEVFCLPVTPNQSTTPSTKYSREMKMLNKREREYTKNIGTIMHKNIMIETNIEEKGFYINTNLK